MPDVFDAVERYLTKDGALHETTRAAENYVVDQCCEAVDKLITAENLNMSRSDVYRVVNALCGEVHKVEALHSALSKYL